jgi:hypothetical protein
LRSLGKACFARAKLETVPFEADSQLAPTEGSFLSACSSTTIGIPRYAVEVDGTSFHPGSTESNSANSSNQGRAVDGSFLVNVAESKAIQDFGCKSDIFIWTQIKILR